MSWQKLVLLNYTLMCLADAPLGLVQPFACSDASSEQTHGLRCGLTKWALLQIVGGDKLIIPFC